MEQSIMKLKFTREEFLEKWRELKGYAPLRNDGAVVRIDGLDIDFGLGCDMDRWYRELLTQGDVALLWPEDVSGAVETESSDGYLEVSLPREAVRVAYVKLRGWRRGVSKLTDPDSNLALRQTSDFARACGDSAVAVMLGDNRLRLYPASEGEEIERLECVMLRDDEFRFDSAALGN